METKQGSQENKATQEVAVEKQREIEIINFDNVGKILTAEKQMIEKFRKQRKPVLNREQKDVMADQLNILEHSLFVVLNHIEGRVKELEKLNKKDK